MSESQDNQVVEELNIKRIANAKAEKQGTYRVTEKAARDDVLDEDGEIVSRGSEGIFKNGNIYKPGDEIELGEQTAARFLELGEIENV